jgi:hypothetical protein
MDMPVNADVHGADGACGQSIGVIIKPASQH